MKYYLNSDGFRAPSLPSIRYFYWILCFCLVSFSYVEGNNRKPLETMQERCILCVINQFFKGLIVVLFQELIISLFYDQLMHVQTLAKFCIWVVLYAFPWPLGL